LFFFLSSSVASTRQPSLSHQHNIFLSKEEIKQLTLRFQLQIFGDLLLKNAGSSHITLFDAALSWIGAPTIF